MERKLGIKKLEVATIASFSAAVFLGLISIGAPGRLKGYQTDYDFNLYYQVAGRLMRDADAVNTVIVSLSEFPSHQPDKNMAVSILKGVESDLKDQGQILYEEDVQVIEETLPSSTNYNTTISLADRLASRLVKDAEGLEVQAKNETVESGWAMADKITPHLTEGLALSTLALFGISLFRRKKPGFNLFADITHEEPSKEILNPNQEDLLEKTPRIQVPSFALGLKETIEVGEPLSKEDDLVARRIINSVFDPDTKS